MYAGDIEVKVKLIFLVAIFLLAAGCGPDEWNGFVYPDASNLTIHEEIGTFDTFENCRNASANRLAALGAESLGTFECGLNCRVDPDFGGMNICEETRD